MSQNLNNMVLEEPKLKLDIDDFINSYESLVEETNHVSNTDSLSYHSDFMSETECIEPKLHVSEMYQPIITHVPVTPTIETKVQTRKNYSKSSTDSTKPIKKPQKTKEIIFKNQSHYIGEHSKRRSLYIRKDSNQNHSIPSSMQSNFPVFTFHTFIME